MKCYVDESKKAKAELGRKNLNFAFSFCIYSSIIIFYLLSFLEANYQYARSIILMFPTLSPELILLGEVKNNFRLSIVVSNIECIIFIFLYFIRYKNYYIYYIRLNVIKTFNSWKLILIVYPLRIFSLYTFTQGISGNSYNSPMVDLASSLLPLCFPVIGVVLVTSVIIFFSSLVSNGESDGL